MSTLDILAGACPDERVVGAAIAVDDLEALSTAVEHGTDDRRAVVHLLGHAKAVSTHRAVCLNWLLRRVPGDDQEPGPGSIDATALLLEVGAESAAALVAHVEQHLQRSSHGGRTALALLRRALPPVLEAADQDLAGWVEATHRVLSLRATDRRGAVRGKAPYAPDVLCPVDAAAVLRALANPAADLATIEAVSTAVRNVTSPVRPQEHDEAIAVLAEALALPAIGDDVLAALFNRHRWVLEASVQAGRTGWIGPADVELAHRHRPSAVRDWVAGLCAGLDERSLLALARLEADGWTGSYEALVQTAAELSRQPAR